MLNCVRDMLYSSSTCNPTYLVLSHGAEAKGSPYPGYGMGLKAISQSGTVCTISESIFLFSSTIDLSSTTDRRNASSPTRSSPFLPPSGPRNTSEASILHGAKQSLHPTPSAIFQSLSDLRAESQGAVQSSVAICLFRGRLESPVVPWWDGWGLWCDRGRRCSRSRTRTRTRIRSRGVQHEIRIWHRHGRRHGRRQGRRHGGVSRD